MRRGFTLRGKTGLNFTDNIAKDPQLLYFSGWFTLDKFRTPNLVTN